MRTRYPLEQGKYTISHMGYRGFLTETAWLPNSQHTGATVYFLSALFHERQTAVAMRASIAGKMDVKLLLPLEERVYHFDTRQDSLDINPHTYRFDLPQNTSFSFDILDLGEGYQFVFYADVARYQSTSNETLLIAPDHLTDAQRDTATYGYFDTRLYYPLLPDWMPQVLTFCRASGMLRELHTLGNFSVTGLQLRPKPIRLFISEQLRQKALPLPS